MMEDPENVKIVDFQPKDKKKCRILEKNGHPNIIFKSIPKSIYFSDMYTTLVDQSWKKTFLMFTVSFYITWLLFAGFYYIICYIHGDLEENHLPSQQEQSGWKPCIEQVEDLASFFLFSFELQDSVGYGFRTITPQCSVAITVVTIQSILGTLIESFLVGLIFAKLSRPMPRAKTVVFSKNAVICEVNKKLCLVLRLGDLRPDSIMAQVALSVKLIRIEANKLGGDMIQHVMPLKISPNSAKEPCLLSMWPTTVMHVIDEQSPLYRMSSDDLSNEQFELHVAIEGVVESTNATLQAKTSYASKMTNSIYNVWEENEKSKKEGMQGTEERVRIMHKNGMPNISFKNIPKGIYWSDFYTTLVDQSWTITLLMSAISFYSTWALFGLIYLLIAYVHGDLDEAVIAGNSTVMPCVENVFDFASAFLFSFELQDSIGFGTRMITTQCSSAIIVVSIQSIFATLIGSFMVGLVLAKLAKPRPRANQVVFSKNAVVCEMNKQLCLVFRLGDLRPDSIMAQVAISVKMMRFQVAPRGQILQEVVNLKITPNSAKEPCVITMWPVHLVHVIDESSPLYRMSADDLANEQLEFHVAIEGVIESTNMTLQIRSSYLPSEVLWGHQFVSMMAYRYDVDKYQINFSSLHSTQALDNMPKCSAYDLQFLSKENTEDDHPEEAEETTPLKQS